MTDSGSWGDLAFREGHTTLSELYTHALNGDWRRVVKWKGLTSSGDAREIAVRRQPAPWTVAVAAAKKAGTSARVAAMKADKPTQKWMAASASLPRATFRVDNHQRRLSVDTVVTFLATTRPDRLSEHGKELQEDREGSLARDGLQPATIAAAFGDADRRAEEKVRHRADRNKRSKKRRTDRLNDAITTTQPPPAYFFHVIVDDAGSESGLVSVAIAGNDTAEEALDKVLCELDIESRKKAGDTPAVALCNFISDDLERGFRGHGAKYLTFAGVDEIDGQLVLDPCSKIRLSDAFETEDTTVHDALRKYYARYRHVLVSLYDHQYTGAHYLGVSGPLSRTLPDRLAFPQLL